MNLISNLKQSILSLEELENEEENDEKERYL
jgi:hypothetical protein